ncbi:MAG: tRNA (guanosine(37)-N1)-methyltransferase TrmD [Dehalococcoidia bacterium]
MHIDILTLFPEMFQGVISSSLTGRAVAGGVVKLDIHNIRDFTHDKHHVVDDYTYGGGPGMVLKPEPIFEAVESIQGDERGWVVLLTPQGRPFSQGLAEEMAGRDRLILICGHYEGVDERVREHLVDDELSIGDYILSGGEIAAMVVVDAVLRLVPGVMGSEASKEEESYVCGLLEYPQYTRPPAFRGWEVPPVLLSGNHREISQWRREQAVLRTERRRPDLLEGASLTEEERRRLGRVMQAESGKENHES